MNRPGEGDATRQRILRVLFEHIQTDSGYLLGVSEIAEGAGLPTRDALYHLRLLDGRGLVRLQELIGGDGFVSLTPLGEQLVREGDASTEGVVPTVGTIIHAPNSSFQNIATNVGGNQLVNVGAPTGQGADLTSLTEQLRREVEAASISDDAKQDALIDVDQMAAESRRRRPKLERIRQNVESLSRIIAAGTPAITAIVEFLKAQGLT